MSPSFLPAAISSSYRSIGPKVVVMTVSFFSSSRSETEEGRLSFPRRPMQLRPPRDEEMTDPVPSLFPSLKDDLKIDHRHSNSLIPHRHWKSLTPRDEETMIVGLGRERQRGRRERERQGEEQRRAGISISTWRTWEFWVQLGSSVRYESFKSGNIRATGNYVTVVIVVTVDCWELTGRMILIMNLLSKSPIWARIVVSLRICHQEYLYLILINTCSHSQIFVVLNRQKSAVAHRFPPSPIDFRRSHYRAKLLYSALFSGRKARSTWFSGANPFTGTSLTNETEAVSPIWFLLENRLLWLKLL